MMRHHSHEKVFLMKLGKRIAALCAPPLILVFSLAATKIEGDAFSKQTGGSTGDSSIVAPDTSSAVDLKPSIAGWYVVVAADSLTSYRVQVSMNGGVRWHTVDFDTVAIASIESTADLGPAYAGFKVRVITDNLSAAGAAFGRSYVKQVVETR
jgi:hypothetical protein